MALRGEIITSRSARAGRSRSQTGGPAGRQLAFRCGSRVIMFWLPAMHPEGQTSARIACTEVMVLNRTDRSAPMPGEAEVKYLDGDFRVVRPGTFVRCAVTGVSIPLEE